MCRTIVKSTTVIKNRENDEVWQTSHWSCTSTQPVARYAAYTRVRAPPPTWQPVIKKKKVGQNICCMCVLCALLGIFRWQLPTALGMDALYSTQNSAQNREHTVSLIADSSCALSIYTEKGKTLCCAKARTGCTHTSGAARLGCQRYTCCSSAARQSHAVAS